MLRQEAIISRQKRQIRHLENQPGRSNTVANDASVQTYTDRSSIQLQSNLSTVKHLTRRIASGDTYPFTNDPSKITTDPELMLQADKLSQNLSSPSSPLGKLKIEQQPQGPSERELDLMVEKERLRLRLKKKTKKEKWFTQKINKMMFFFFTLQNKGVPVNEIYEQEGIKAIKTDRFDEIMKKIAEEN